MYKPEEINNEKMLAGYLRCPQDELSRIIDKKDPKGNDCMLVLNIPKKNRALGYRKVYIAIDSQIQNVLKHLKFELNKLYNPLVCVGGFVKGRNIAYNAKFHIGQKVVLNLDLQNFFENIPSNKIIQAFEGMGFQEAISKTLAQIVTYNNILVPGLHTSPLIANMVCLSMDTELLVLCKKHGISYSRYADDLSFSGDKMEIEPEIREIIQRNGFIINEEKRRLYKAGRSQYVTGLSVADKSMPRIPRRIKKRLRAEIYCIKEHGLESHLSHKYGITIGGNFSQFDDFARRETARITGWINFMNGIEPVFAKKCMEQINQISDANTQAYFSNADMYIEQRKFK